MSLRTKAIVIIGVAVIVMVAAIYGTSRLILTSGLLRIENYEVQKSIQRSLGVLSQTVAELEVTLTDWAVWDDTYDFVQDANEEYIQRNLADSTFVYLGLNLMLFADSSGRVVFSKAFDLDNKRRSPVAPQLLDSLSRSYLLGSGSETKNSTSGIILLDEGPMLIASQPILKSDFGGPWRGTLIFGRYLDATELSRLAQLTLSDVSLSRTDRVLNADFREALPSLSTAAPVFVHTLDARTIAGYTLLKDIRGNPALILRVTMPRDASLLGQGAVVYHVLAILVIGLLGAGVVILIMQKQVISRLAVIANGLNKIATTGDMTTRLPFSGNDELTLIARTMNGVMAALEESSAELRKRYEQEKIVRQQLEEEIQKRIEYTRALVHELKTPVTPVLAAAELLLEEVKEERLMRLVQSIDRSASNLNQRIDELLDLARGETGMLQLALETVDLMPLFKEIGQEMVPVAEHNGQSMTVELPASLPAVRADRGRIRQVVLNLLSNALKFTPAGGRITLSARTDGANLVVEVKDTGPGISQEEQEHLFQPYYQRATEKDRLGGLGLGLSLAKTFVELHGGRIWVKSQIGKGSTFGFSLPLAAANPKGES